MSTPTSRVDWRRAACLDATDPTLFDSTSAQAGAVPRRARQAAQHCRVCPIRSACLDYALDSRLAGNMEAVTGTWGGVYFSRGPSGAGRLTACDLLAPVVADEAAPELDLRAGLEAAA